MLTIEMLWKLWRLFQYQKNLKVAIWIDPYNKQYLNLGHLNFSMNVTWHELYAKWDICQTYYGGFDGKLDRLLASYIKVLWITRMALNNPVIPATEPSLTNC